MGEPASERGLFVQFVVVAAAPRALIGVLAMVTWQIGTDARSTRWLR